MAAPVTVQIGAHRVIVADSVTSVDGSAAGRIVVTGSHGGRSAAHFAIKVHAALYVFNDAGVGKQGAGIAGLADLQAAGIAAGTVSHLTARIGEARDTLDHGVISHVNGLAAALGLVTGCSLCTAIAQLREVK